MLTAAIIGGGSAILGSALGGVFGAGAARRQRALLEAQKRENQNWYDRRYNEDATQRADAQRLLTMTEESIRNRNRQAAGAAAVMGGSAEAGAHAKAANNEALAQTMSAINASAESRKEQIDAQYRGQQADSSAQLAGLEAERKAQIGQAVGGAISAAGNSVASAIAPQPKKI